MIPRYSLLLPGLVLALCLGWVDGIQAQTGPPLAVQGRQDLSFGELLGGLAARIDPSDPAGSAQLRVRGVNGQTIEIAFSLPPGLEHETQGTIPLLFGASDAHFSASGGVGDRVPFDPTTPWPVTLTEQGWSWIFLGGTALPPVQAPLGRYSGTITLTVSDLGS